MPRFDWGLVLKEVLKTSGAPNPLAREVRNESVLLLGLIDPEARGHREPMLLRACYAHSIGKN